jgi:CRP-like cAMP-binding protein
MMKFKELERGQLLYSKGDNSQYFYFVLKGKLEILVDNTQHSLNSLANAETSSSTISSQ